MKLKDQRVGVFVDVQNLYYSAKNLYGAKVNFGEVLKTAVADRLLIRAIAYVIKADNVDEQKFFEAQSRCGLPSPLHAGAPLSATSFHDSKIFLASFSSKV